MFRFVRICLSFSTLAIVTVSGARIALGADDGPWLEMPKYENPGQIYLSPFKLLLCWFVFLSWVKTTDWASQDAQRLSLNYRLWNPLLVSSFVAGMVVLWVIPFSWGFFVGFPLLFISYVVPLWLYVAHRNADLAPHRQVGTPDHIRFLLSRALKPIGIKISADNPDDVEEGPPVEIIACGAGSERDDRANLLLVRQSAGFVPTKELVSAAISRRAESILLDFEKESVAVRYRIDGVWHNVGSQSRERADALLAVLKTVSSLDPQQRREKQQGMFEIAFDGARFAMHLTSQGTKTGERAMIKIDGGKKTYILPLDDLGMRDKTREDMLQLLNGKQGMILFSALPEGGLTTTVNSSLTAGDRLTRDVVSLQRVDRREPEIENVEVVTYDPNAGQTAEHVLGDIILKYPDVLHVPDLSSPELTSVLCHQVHQDRIVVVSIRAREACEALLRVLALKIKSPVFAKAISAVVHTQLLRRLCAGCKEPYRPSADELQKIGLPPARVQQLFRPRSYQQPAGSKQPITICKECGGVGYLGRVAIVEYLSVDDTVRKVLIQKPEIGLLRKAARNAKARTIAQEGAILVARGITSVQELARVLKQ